MSRADTATRILDAAIALGVAEGVGALSLQGVASAAGVSKALVLYHYDGKDRLLEAVAERLAMRDAEALEAAAASDALEACGQVVAAAAMRASRALLAALLQEASLRAIAARVTARRAAAATTLALAVLDNAGLRPRIAAPLVGRALLQHADGLAVTASGRSEAAVDAERDALMLALLGLGN